MYLKYLTKLLLNRFKIIISNNFTFEKFPLSITNKFEITFYTYICKCLQNFINIDSDIWYI